MKVFTISAALTVLVTTASTRSVEARTVSDAKFTMSGYGEKLPYPSYTLSIPENNKAVQITNKLVVYSIDPASDQYNCTFIGVHGSVTNIGPTSDLDPPQAQVSVTCK